MMLLNIICIALIVSLPLVVWFNHKISKNPPEEWINAAIVVSKCWAWVALVLSLLFISPYLAVVFCAAAIIMLKRSK